MDEYPIIDLSHLLPAAQGLARLPADERIQRLRADRWIGYPRAVEALNRLEALYAWPNKLIPITNLVLPMLPLPSAHIPQFQTLMQTQRLKLGMLH